MSNVPTEPGVYEGLPFEEYLAIDAVSRSELVDLMRSPAFAKQRRDARVQEETEALRVGSALHCAVLEPSLFEDAYLLCEERFHKSQKEETAIKNGYDGGREAYAAMVETAGGRTIVHGSEARTLVGIRDAMAQSPAASSLLFEEGPGILNEVTLAWRDAETGLLCKARLDRTFESAKGERVIVDLKSARESTAEAFGRDAIRRRLHLQDAWYSIGWHAARGMEPPDLVFGPAPTFVFVAYEKVPPYSCDVFQFDTAARDVALQEITNAMRLYAQCVERDEWPGTDTKVRPLALPTWYATWRDTLFGSDPSDLV